jgi:hypothetical protein
MSVFGAARLAATHLPDAGWIYREWFSPRYQHKRGFRIRAASALVAWRWIDRARKRGGIRARSQTPFDEL